MPAGETAGNWERDYKNNIFSRFADSAVSTQREEFRRWGVMADWARPYLTNSPDYVNTQLDMFLRLYQAGHIFRWGAELFNFNFLRRFHNIHNNAQLLYATTY